MDKKKSTVLIIDDEFESSPISTLIRILEINMIDVCTVSDVITAKSVLEEDDTIDVIVLDLVLTDPERKDIDEAFAELKPMPTYSTGIEFLEFLNEQFPEIQVIVYTACLGHLERSS